MFSQRGFPPEIRASLLPRVSPYMTLPRVRCDADAGVRASGGLRAPRLVLPSAAPAEVERLIYRPAGEACLDFLNLKSQSTPPPPMLSYSPLRFTTPPAVCGDMCAAILPCTRIPTCMFVMCAHVSRWVCYLRFSENVYIGR